MSIATTPINLSLLSNIPLPTVKMLLYLLDWVQSWYGGITNKGDIPLLVILLFFFI